MILMAEAPPRSRSDVSIAIVCALPDESTAVMAMFDEHWDTSCIGDLPNDMNEYSLGKISTHNVIVVHLPRMGTNSAAASIGRLYTVFGGIELVLAVGICGGTPSTDREDIFLGDVVVSNSIVQYDFGKQYPHTFQRKHTVGESLPHHGTRLLSFLHKMNTLQTRTRFVHNMHLYLDKILAQSEFAGWKQPPPITDRLFVPSYRHKHQDAGVCELCDACQQDWDEPCEEALRTTCEFLGCKNQYARLRNNMATSSQQSPTSLPNVHFGTVASGNQVMKSAIHRDRIATQEDAIAFEMEGAGLWDHGSTLVIKGVCDYADSHKNNDWQRFASVAAASCMKALLSEWISTHAANRSRGLAYTTGSRPEGKAEEVADTLWFREIADRFDGIEEAQFESFQWIFNEYQNPLLRRDHRIPHRRSTSEKADSALSKYMAGFRRGLISEWDPCGLKTWLRSGEGIFWITGKPGCGKSTLMKLISGDNHYMDLLCTWAKGCTLLTTSYFSWRAGSELQKSQLGFLQSILYQTLKSHPNLVLQILEPIEQDDILKMNATKESSTRSLWTIEHVRGILTKLLRHNSIKLCILIDGLDEMEWAYMDMVEFLTKLTKHDKVKILASGRYLAEFARPFQGFTTIQLHEWTAHDIEVYVTGRLLSNQYLCDQAEEAREDFDHLIDSILDKAEGVFIWVRTAVTALIEGIYKADNIVELQKRLDALPPELFDLYEVILHSLDEMYVDEFKHFLSLILAAEPWQRSSKIISLAVCYDHKDPNWIFSQSQMGFHAFQRLQAQTKRRLESVCSQFIYFPPNEEGPGWRVDFMHKTVFDFLKTPKIQLWLSASNRDPEDYKIAAHVADFTCVFSSPGGSDRNDIVQGMQSFSVSRGIFKLLAGFPDLALPQLDVALAQWFGNQKEFFICIKGAWSVNDWYPYGDNHSFMVHVGSFYLENLWSRNLSSRRLTALVDLLLDSKWLTLSPRSLPLKPQMLAMEDCVDVIILDMFLNPDRYVPSNVYHCGEAMLALFQMAGRGIEMCWRKIILVVNCQANIPPGSYRQPDARFFTDKFVRIVESILHIGVDVNVLVECSPNGQEQVVLQSPLRVFRRCEELAKTVETVYKAKHGWTPGMETEHVEEITAIIDLLLEYGAEEIEERPAGLVPHPEENDLTQYLTQCRTAVDKVARDLLASDRSGDKGYECVDYWRQGEQEMEWMGNASEDEVDRMIDWENDVGSVSRTSEDPEDQAQAQLERYEDEDAVLEYYSRQFEDSTWSYGC